MQLLQQAIEKIQAIDQEMMVKARERVDALSKPPKSIVEKGEHYFRLWRKTATFFMPHILLT